MHLRLKGLLNNSKTKMPVQVQDQLNDSMRDALETKRLAELTASAITGQRINSDDTKRKCICVLK
jgi:hypothetical protein